MLDLSGPVAALVLGFLLGLKHATDADHVVAVSTIVSEYRNAWRGLWVGASWGLGHTTPLFVVGIAILLLRGSFLEPERFSPALEFLVGVMLVFLGLQVFWSLRRRRIHAHEHGHVQEAHAHRHTHELPVEPESHHGFLHLGGAGKPFFRLKSYLVGLVHGLAGSAIVLLALLTTTPFWAGIGLIFLFGVGTILSMGLLTFLMGIPFALSGRYERLNRAIAGVAGAASIGFGAFLMYEIGVVEGLFA
ncbi:MAG: urease accessory protein UreH [Dehalococcoidia bacterium]|nr:urease accessory protein UreH [Dehalococcoidia bacterium]